MDRGAWDLLFFVLGQIMDRISADRLDYFWALCDIELLIGIEGKDGEVV